MRINKAGHLMLSFIIFEMFDENQKKYFNFVRESNGIIV